MHLYLYPGEYCICKLPARAEAPEWAQDSPFTSITRTKNELSIVTEINGVPQTVEKQCGWRLLAIAGLLEFSLTGIIAAIAGPLAENRISIFTIATYDTDYFLVEEENLNAALRVLRDHDFTIEDITF